MATKRYTSKDGKTYEVEMTPDRYFASVTEIGLVDLGGGPVARAFESIAGKPLTSEVDYVLSQDEQNQIIAEAGRNFSKRIQWQRSWRLAADV